MINKFVNSYKISYMRIVMEIAELYFEIFEYKNNISTYTNILIDGPDTLHRANVPHNLKRAEYKNVIIFSDVEIQKENIVEIYYMSREQIHHAHLESMKNRIRPRMEKIIKKEDATNNTILLSNEIFNYMGIYRVAEQKKAIDCIELMNSLNGVLGDYYLQNNIEFEIKNNAGDIKIYDIYAQILIAMLFEVKENCFLQIDYMLLDREIENFDYIIYVKLYGGVPKNQILANHNYFYTLQKIHELGDKIKFFDDHIIIEINMLRTSA